MRSLRNIISALRRVARPLSGAAMWIFLSVALGMIVLHSTSAAFVREGFEDGDKGGASTMEMVIDNTLRSKKNEQDIADIQEKIAEAEKSLASL
jgi:hypothetical protein